MESPQNPGDPTYRRSLGTGSLVLRWSTAADKAGCILLSCLAAMQEEGKRRSGSCGTTIPSRMTRFTRGARSSNWALCVDTSPVDKPAHTSGDTQGLISYVDSIHMAADSALERVVVLVYFLPAEFAFDDDAVCVPVGKARIVACKTAYRQRSDGENIMKALFEMLDARATSVGSAFMVTPGIPGYYRTHGYEYAMNIGRGLVTHTSALPLNFRPADTDTDTNPSSADAAYALRPATLADLPAVERLYHAQRATPDIFPSAAADAPLKHLRWALGDRPDAYPAPTYPVSPFFVLEKRGGGAQAADAGADADANAGAEVGARIVAAAVTLALVRALVPALNALPAPAPAGEASSTKYTFPLPYQNLPLTQAHFVPRQTDRHPALDPLRRAPPAALAPRTRARHPAARVLGVRPHDRLVGLRPLPPALPRGAPARAHRALPRAAPVLGGDYSAVFHIAGSRGKGGGAVLRVADGGVSVDSPARARAPVGVGRESSASANSAPPPPPLTNFFLPRGALVQLLLGYTGWRELKAVFPTSRSSRRSSRSWRCCSRGARLGRGCTSERARERRVYVDLALWVRISQAGGYITPGRVRV
ncbi:hypothetical protein B0H11DRAFT_2326020 [Mycena galericulata]|nr:hypothetical protein B0H11DRAFT_2326020 [Mycena galericulata]